MFDIILFDLDGTLTNPYEGITKSIVYALEKFGITGVDRESLKSFIGPPLTESFEKYFGFSKQDALRAVEYYREYYSQTGIYECELYNGIESTLADLKKKGKTVGLATCKPEPFALQLLQHFNIDKYFDMAAGATFDDVRNKKAAVIDYALEKLNRPEKSTVLMVGDRLHDVYGAKTNNIKCAGVTFGFGGKDELREAGADFIINSPQELLFIV